MKSLPGVGFFVSLCLLNSPIFAKSLCLNEAADYAQEISKLTAVKDPSSPQAPFMVKALEQRTINFYYFSELGYDKKQINHALDMQKINPIEVYDVSLESSDHWDCLYQVTFSVKVNCLFKSVSFNHCAQ
jgi:hypothetical protein